MHSKTSLSPPCSGGNKPLTPRENLVAKWEEVFRRVPSYWDQFWGWGYHGESLLAVLRASNGAWVLASFVEREPGEWIPDFQKVAPSFEELREIVPQREWAAVSRGQTYVSDVVEEALREIHSSED